MPELPEVETTRRGISPFITNKPIQKMIVRQPQLRWPIPTKLKSLLKQHVISAVSRRGKYLLFTTDIGTMIVHLGMSGSLRILPINTAAEKHDHVDLVFTDTLLRYTDPRRFGSILWTEHDPHHHKLLCHLGPEPLSRHCNAQYFFTLSRTRKVAIKTFLMNHKVVVGVGNIYANEALFSAHIHPLQPANTLSKQQFATLTPLIKKILKKAIRAGGTTLKDFQSASGQPGYFSQQLNVYGRQDQPCPVCNCAIKKIVINQRASFYCPSCQPTY